MNEIAKRLGDFLQSKGLSVNKAARDCGLSTRQLNDFVTGVSQNMQLSSIATICKTYSLSADYLLLGKTDYTTADHSLIGNGQVVNDTTILDLSRGKTTLNSGTDNTAILAEQVRTQQETILALQIAIDRLTQTNQALTNKILNL